MSREYSKHDLEYMALRNASHIRCGDKVAQMTQEDFDKLLTYNTSVPTGVYVGKRWKCDRNWHGQFGKEPQWTLCEFQEIPDDDKHLRTKVWDIQIITSYDVPAAKKCLKFHEVLERGPGTKFRHEDWSEGFWMTVRKDVEYRLILQTEQYFSMGWEARI